MVNLAYVFSKWGSNSVAIDFRPRERVRTCRPNGTGGHVKTCRGIILVPSDQQA